MLLLSLLSIIDDREYVIILRKVENEGTQSLNMYGILHVWNFNVHVQLDWGGGGVVTRPSPPSHFFHKKGLTPESAHTC